MKITIKTTLAAIVIAFSASTAAQAGPGHHERDYDRGYFGHYDTPHKRHMRKHMKRHHWERKHRHEHRRDHYREMRHWRKHKRLHRRAEGHMRIYKHMRRHHSDWGHKRHHAPRYQESYVVPRHTTSGLTVSTRLHTNNALPVIAGGLVGSAIANDVSHGDPAATVGGAVFGALIGNAISRH